MSQTSNANALRAATAREGICLFERSAIAGTRHVDNIEESHRASMPRREFYLERDRGTCSTSGRSASSTINATGSVRFLRMQRGRRALARRRKAHVGAFFRG